MSTLASLRPKASTDLLGLVKFLDEREGTNGGMPRALPEVFLLAVGRDMRAIEDQLEEEDSSHDRMAGPIVLVLSILQTIAPALESFSIGEDALFEALAFYQWAVEREIVYRVTGSGSANDMNVLHARLTEIASRLMP